MLPSTAAFPLFLTIRQCADFSRARPAETTTETVTHRQTDTHSCTHSQAKISLGCSI